MSHGSPGDVCARLRSCMAQGLMTTHDGAMICGACAQRADRLHDPRVPKALRSTGLPMRSRAKKGVSRADGPDRSTRLPVTRMPSHPLAHSKVWW